MPGFHRLRQKLPWRPSTGGRRAQPELRPDAQPDAASVTASVATSVASSAQGSNSYVNDNRQEQERSGDSLVDPVARTESSSSTPPTTTTQSLWDRAYDALAKKETKLVKDYEGLLSNEEHLAKTKSTPNDGPLAQPFPAHSGLGPDPDSQSRQIQLNTEIQRLQQMGDRKRVYTIGHREFVLTDQIAQVAKLILWGKDLIGDAVQASPAVAIVWSGVCIVLPLLTNAQTAAEARSNGFEDATARMHYYLELEHLLKRLGQNADVSQGLMSAAENFIIDLYQHILDFQIRTILRFYDGNFKAYVKDIVPLTDWKQMASDIATCDGKVTKCLRQINELVAGQELESLNETSTAILEATKGVLSVVTQQLAVSEEMLALKKEAKQQKLSAKQEECLQLFRLTSGAKDVSYEWYKNRVEDRVEGTCQWFLSHDDFQRWLQQESGPLLVSADPGCGKSVLAKYLIDHGLPRSAAICYFFFKDQDQNTVRQALCALLHQLFTQIPALIEHAMPAYSTNGDGLVGVTESLWKILDSATRDPQAGPVIIVLDALDECTELEFGNLIRHVRHQSHSSQAGNVKLKFLLTSRPYSQIVSEFNDLLDAFPRVHIPGEEHSEAIGQEVNLVVKERANKLANQLRLSSTIRDHLTEKLLEIPHRTYLWVYLVFDHLKMKGFRKTAKGAESAIMELPTTVNEAYDQILNKSKDPEKAHKALAMILAARRPLTLSEMNVAVNVEDTHKSFHDLDLEEDEDFKSSLRSWCGLFISIHHGKVYFLHQTAREFLLADLSSSPPVPSNLHWHRSITARHAHTFLAEKCVLYLDFFNSEKSGYDIGNDAFLDYSAQYWCLHFREADIADNSPIVSSASRICNPDSMIYSAWSGIYWEVTYMETPGDWTSIFVLSYFGLEAVIKLLLATGKVDADSKDTDGRTPLSWAAEEGYEAVVKLLLATGKVDVDSKDTEFGQTPLSWAAMEGHEAVVKLLLATGKVDADSKDTDGRTPLSWAAKEGHEAVVKLLLATGNVDADSKDTDGRTPLSWAAAGGHEAVVKLLLTTGRVDADSKDTKYCRTPLLWAAAGGHEAVVKLLLAMGRVDADSKDKDGQTPLSRAVAAGHEAVVKLLEAHLGT